MTQPITRREALVLVGAGAAGLLYPNLFAEAGERRAGRAGKDGRHRGKNGPTTLPAEVAELEPLSIVPINDPVLVSCQGVAEFDARRHPEWNGYVSATSGTAPWASSRRSVS